jgi:hypothetical protein
MQRDREIPPVLAIVAYLFLLQSVLALFEMIGKWIDHNANIDFTVFLGILTYLGLRRFSKGWRTWALITLWLDMIGCSIGFVWCLRDPVPWDFLFLGKSIAEIPSIWVAISFIPLFLLAVWQYRVLTRPDIRHLFIPADPAMQHTA